ncbi:MAG TPA: BamA/TamA family outer membrane protein [Candidatus Krumholzibacteria bacterium]|nr:BamA/TamA family outer membrane protein [Candidatus Krumholzibacteria bacterium]
MRKSDLIRVVVAGLMAFAAPRAAHAFNITFAPPDSTAAGARTRSVVAGEHYRAGGLHRFLLGSDYRNLWTAPIDVPELDLAAFAGGLTAVKRVGGQQTLGLAMKGADGRAYTFRGLDKDPTEILPPEYHGTLVNRVLQDQIASSFPGGAVAVPPLLEAAGVLHARPVLFVMPDDPRLGEFQSLFAGVLGTLEEYPLAAGNGNPGFAGATEIISGEELWTRMDESPATRPDSRAFLTARLVDLLIGDWDRHRGQWRWAWVPDHDAWLPIPEDRDQAFVRFEGLLPAAGRQHLPQFVSFDDDYPSVEGLTWNGRDGDRRILVDVEKPVWDAVALELRGRITDAVIADAVSRLPRPYRDIQGAELDAALRERRDHLPDVANRFYRLLARDVDVHATRQSEHVVVTRTDAGDVAVRISLIPAANTTPSAPYFERVFHANETDEVRIYLGGGADSVVATGTGGGITVRVIDPDGNDVIDDAAGARLRVADASGTSQVLRGPGTRVDTRAYTPPERETAPWIPPRDWGRRNIMYGWVGGNSDLGVLFLGTLESEGYGFRKDPYADKQTFRLGYATRAGAFGGDYRGRFRHENSPRMTGMYARISGLDVLHFYGFGNETTANEDESYYKVKHTEYVFEPSLILPKGETITTTLRATAKYTKTNLDEDHYINTALPYGTDEFFQVGAGAEFAVDTRDSPANATRGYHFTAAGTVFPPLGKVESTFGEAHAEAAVYRTASIPLTPTLALRVGGKAVWGEYPWHEAAYLGGSASLRGFASQRFAGDASAYGGAELRVPLTHIYLFVPGNVGVFALGDVGRVFVDGESSDRWHTSAGGGIWLSLVDPDNTISISVVGSEEDTRVYVRAGMGI